MNSPGMPATAVGAGSFAVVIAWALGLVGVDVSLEVGVAIGGLLASVGLLVWHNGLRGIGRRLWRGWA